MTLTVPASVLEEARAVFEQEGMWGREVTGLLLGQIQGDDEHVIHRVVIPEQRASAAPSCWVEVTEVGKLQLAAALGPDQRWIARIHSHPGEAFHSPTDDANPVLTAEGSWSIVVPYFGLGLRRGISACAILRFSRGRWRRLTGEEIKDGIRVIDG